ncbi:beta-glucosidase [Rhyzopertha dominica]|nr:beta-glucosidase [Rhyzopertha dominica]
MLFLIVTALLTKSVADASEAFPDDFLFGVSTSAYQVEGAWNESGKGENSWDHYLHSNPDYTEDGSNADIACDSYHKYKEDVALLKNMGVDFYRFSISWSRVLPTGFINKINQDGIQYYNNLINELLSNGIQPMVTLHHWDMPQALQELGSWNNPFIADYFVDYARLLFKNYGDRVKWWITFNEPCNLDFYSLDVKLSGISNYMCNRVTALAHARVYRMYEKEFKDEQRGQIGLTVSIPWSEPFSDSPSDVEAAQRANDFSTVLLHPLYTGDYPEVMKERVRFRSLNEGFTNSRLRDFTQEEREVLKGTFDFIGLNYYTTILVKDLEEAPFNVVHDDSDRKFQRLINNKLPAAKSPWIRVYPFGMRKTLNYLKNRYGNPPIIITENGFSDDGELEDYGRINFIADHLEALLASIHEDGVNVIAYTAWSLLDNFEWQKGYTEKFGLHKVDFADPDRTRTPKKSAYVYAEIIRQRKVVRDVTKQQSKQEL